MERSKAIPQDLLLGGDGGERFAQVDDIEGAQRADRFPRSTHERQSTANARSFGHGPRRGNGAAIRIDAHETASREERREPQVPLPVAASQVKDAGAGPQESSQVRNTGQDDLQERRVVPSGRLGGGFGDVGAATARDPSPEQVVEGVVVQTPQSEVRELAGAIVEEVLERG